MKYVNSKNVFFTLLMLIILAGLISAPWLGPFLKNKHKAIREKSKIMAISFHKPPTYDVVQQWIVNQGNVIESDKKNKADYTSFGNFLEYYYQLAEYMSNNAALWFVHGTFAGILGKDNVAQESLMKSLKLEPRYFWSYHNLAVIMTKHRYCTPQFYQILKQAKQLPLQTVNLYVNKTPVFQPFWVGLKEPQKVVAQNYLKGQRNIQWMIDHCGQSVSEKDLMMFLF